MTCVRRHFGSLSASSLRVGRIRSPKGPHRLKLSAIDLRLTITKSSQAAAKIKIFNTKKRIYCS